MEQYQALLSCAQLSIVSAEPGDLDAVARTIAPCARVGGRDELGALLAHWVVASRGAPVRPRTLDLFGHSTASAGLLRLGDWVIDAAEPEVAAWFGALADAEVLPRLGVRALRLLGCRTAATRRGRATITALAAMLEVEVYGTPHLLYDAHHDAGGFRAAWQFLLVGSSELARAPEALAALAPAPRRQPGPHTLALDAWPATPLGPLPGWPRRIASRDDAHRILPLIERDAGACLGTAPAAPRCELALPAARPGGYHVADVLHDGAFLQFYPDGAGAPGVAFPVIDAGALLQIIEALPATTPPTAELRT